MMIREHLVEFEEGELMSIRAPRGESIYAYAVRASAVREAFRTKPGAVIVEVASSSLEVACALSPDAPKPTPRRADGACDLCGDPRGPHAGACDA